MFLTLKKDLTGYGINAQSLEIKGFKITFDYKTAGMAAGQFRQAPTKRRIR